MKRLGAIFLAFVLVFYSLSGLVPLISYELNKNYISKILCENKARPKMRCNGHCHLVKEIKKEKEREQVPGNTVTERHEILLFSEVSGLELPVLSSNTLKHYSLYKACVSSLNLFSVFHPPRG